jgi:hypothetical protein
VSKVKGAVIWAEMAPLIAYDEATGAACRQEFDVEVQIRKLVGTCGTACGTWCRHSVARRDQRVHGD